MSKRSEYRAAVLGPKTIAFIEANVKRLAAKPMPDHVALAVAKIWNSASNNTPRRKDDE